MVLVESSSKSRAANMVAGAVSLGVALLIGEALFKFGSFTREVLAFLPTWGGLYLAAKAIGSLLSRRTE